MLSLVLGLNAGVSAYADEIESIFQKNVSEETDAETEETESESETESETETESEVESDSGSPVCRYAFSECVPAEH